jgi:hypothetical protein
MKCFGNNSSSPIRDLNEVPSWSVCAYSASFNGAYLPMITFMTVTFIMNRPENRLGKVRKIIIICAPSQSCTWIYMPSFNAPDMLPYSQLALKLFSILDTRVLLGVHNRTVAGILGWHPHLSIYIYIYIYI